MNWQEIDLNAVLEDPSIIDAMKRRIRELEQAIETYEADALRSRELGE